MTAESPSYQPFGRSTLESSLAYRIRHRLFTGPDHLLLVRQEGYRETYRRLYFRDIQAVIVRRTVWNRIYAAWLGTFTLAILLLAAVLAVKQSPPPAALIVFLIAWIPGLGLLINAHRGPTCDTWIQSAVQCLPLKPLNRLPLANRFIAAVRQPVESAQGTLNPAALQAFATDSAAPSGLGPETSSTPATDTATIPVLPFRPYRGHAHTVLFALLLVDLAHSLFRFHSTAPVMLITGLILSIALLTSLILALSRQAGTRLPNTIQGLTWTTLVYLVLAYSFHSSLMMFRLPTWNHSSPASLLQVLYPPAGTSMITTSFLVLSALMAGLTGSMGLVQLYRRQSGHPPPPPSPP